MFKRKKAVVYTLCLSGNFSAGSSADLGFRARSAGHTIKQTCTKSCDYLVVAGAVDAHSSKVVAAKKYGVEIKNEKWLLSLLPRPPAGPFAAAAAGASKKKRKTSSSSASSSVSSSSSSSSSSAAAAAAAAATGLPFKSPLLAKQYDAEKHDPTGWHMSEKLDGIRAVWCPGQGFLTRKGHKVVGVPAEFAADFPCDVHLDGEFFAGAGNFATATSFTRSHGKSYDQWSKAIKYCVFDAPMLAGDFETRAARCAEVCQSLKHAAWCVQTVCTGKDHLERELAKVEKAGGEGLMLRQPGSAYEYKRSSTLLKVKTMHDAEAKVIGHEPGKGRLAGMCGALLCRGENGKTFKVGSGLNDDDRRNPPPIGCVITYKYFEVTKAGVPRFPTFLRIFPGRQ
jgi:DNA ligase-1